MDISALTRRLDPGPERLARLARLYAAIVVPALLLVLIVMESPRADGRHDLSGATFGHDFSQVWVAGRTALAGHAAQVYDIAAHYRHLVATFGPDAALFAWHYPPIFLLPAALLARLPYPAALIAWDSASLLLLAVALRAILGGWRPALIGLAVPTVADSLAYGQNGLLTASLLGLGLRLADRRPWAAGVLLGLVGYKPQLAALVPFVLLLDGDRRVAVAALATVAATAAASVAAFGIDPWIAFVHGLPDTNADIFTEVWAGRALNASAFGAVRLLGGPIAAAWVVQVVVAVAALGLAMWTRYRVRAAPGGPALANAVLLAAVPLVSPYVPLYDLAVLVPAGAFLVVGAEAAGGLTAGERAAVAPLFVLAFATGRTAAAHVPAGFLLTIGLFSLAVVAALRRAHAVAAGGSASCRTASGSRPVGVRCRASLRRRTIRGSRSAARSYPNDGSSYTRV